MWVNRYADKIRPSRFFHLSVEMFMYFLIAFSLLLALKEFLASGNITSQYVIKEVTVKVLEVIILYELLRAILSIFEYRRVKLTFLVDASISFMLREMIMIMYSGKLNLERALSFSLILLVLSVMRVVVVKYSPNIEV